VPGGILLALPCSYTGVFIHKGDRGRKLWKAPLISRKKGESEETELNKKGTEDYGKILGTRDTEKVESSWKTG
jgi:hypothetical protein